MTLARAQKPGAGWYSRGSLAEAGQQRSPARSGSLALLGSGAGIHDEPVRRGGRSGGHGAGLRRRGRGAAATHGAPPSVLFPAASTQPLRSADADQCCPTAAGRGAVRTEAEGMWSDGGGWGGVLHPREEEAPEGVWSERASGLRGKVSRRMAGLREYEGIVGLTEEASKRIMNLKLETSGEIRGLPLRGQCVWLRICRRN